MLIRGLPHLLLATPNAGGVDPLPGKEASLGEEGSSLGEAGRHEACRDLSPVTPAAHQVSTLGPGFMVAIIPPKDHAGDLSPCLGIILTCGARGFPWAQGSRSEISSQRGCKGRLGQYPPIGGLSQISIYTAPFA